MFHNKNKVYFCTEAILHFIALLPVSVFVYFRVDSLLLGWLKVSVNNVLLGSLVILAALLVLLFSFRYKFPVNVIRTVINFKASYSYITTHVFLLIAGSLFGLLTGRQFLEASVGEYELTKNTFVITMAHLGAGIICVIYILMLISAVITLLKGNHASSFIPKHNYAGILSIVLIVNVATVVYLVNTCWIYFWDIAGYWEVSSRLSGFLFNKLPDYLGEIGNSIVNYDYNYLASIPITIVEKLFGTSRYIYILGIQNVYFIPSIIPLYILARFVKKITDNNVPTLLLVVSALLFIPYAFYIGLVGFVDIGGLFIMMVCTWLYFKNDKYILQRYFIIGNLLALLYMFRRWYMFWTASFIICAFVYTLITGIKMKKSDCSNTRSQILSYLALVTGTAFTLLYFLQPLVINKLLTNNYSDSYSAYNFGIDYDYFSFVRHFGLIIFILVFIGAVYLTIKAETRKYLLFLLGQSLLCLIFIRRIQSHGQQHFLLYVPAISMILMMLFSSLTAQKFSAGRRRVLVCSILVLGIFNTGMTLVDTGYNPERPDQLNRNTFFPNFKLIPRVRYDTTEILRLANYLDKLSENGIKKISVLASSLDFNNEIIVNVEKSLNIKIADNNNRSYLTSYPAVDKRDGFPYSLFSSDYVVVADPVQYHLDPKDQRVVGIPAQSFLNNDGVAKAYIRLDETFTIKDNINIYIYKKVREATIDEKRELAGKLWNYYPDRPALFPLPENIY